MTDAPKRIWEFDRYINGVLMAEGVTVEKQPDIASAMKAAAIIASRGPHGEVPVLIVREGASEHAALIREAEAERDEAQRLMQMRHREMLAADELMRKHQGRAVAAEADRDRLAAANAVLEARVAGLRSALIWARDRIDVDGGMTERETAATAAELLNVLLGKPSPASSFSPEAWQSPTLRAMTPVNDDTGMEACGKCMGSGYGGHPDSGAICSDCGGKGVSSLNVNVAEKTVTAALASGKPGEAGE